MREIKEDEVMPGSAAAEGVGLICTTNVVLPNSSRVVGQKDRKNGETV